jgi:uncharacterized protein (DUF2141 family)
MLPLCIRLVLISGFLVPGPLSATELKVEIRGVPSAEGTVDVAIFDDPANFLAKRTAGIKVPAGQRPTVATFADLRPGTYAVSVFHDANGNGTLDRNLFGLPTEKYGFSRDAPGRMGPPDFEDAALTIGSQGHAIIINLR